MKQKDILITRLRKLPTPLLRIIYCSRDLAKRQAVGVYLVGGFVRDLLLGVENLDLDLVVEREGIDFAYRLASLFDAQLIKHRAFGTATITTKDGIKIDIATSRKEYYPAPAALPRVTGGSIEDDLSRRDFTINALACHIDSERFGELVDFFDGIGDLRKKRIQFLHEKSFIDDPTRIIRAVRFEQRLGFRIDATTARFIRLAKKEKMLERVHKHRLRDELILVFKEKEPYKLVRRLDTLYNLTFVDPGLALRSDLKNKFDSIRTMPRRFQQIVVHKRGLELWLMYLSLFVSVLGGRQLHNFLRAYAFRRTEAIRILSFKKEFVRLKKQLSKKSLSSLKLHALLDPLSYEVIMLIDALSGKKIVRQRIKEFFVEYHHKKITITGHDLLSLGLKPGPGFRVIFRKVFRAKINGTVHNRREELALARKIIKSA